jgi:hypothetical protein
MKLNFKAILKFCIVFFMGLAIGLTLFFGLTYTDFYQKMKRGEALIIQEALPVLYVTDPDVGLMMTPHTKIHFKTPYFDTTIVTNTDGFTGRDYPLKTDNYRIAVMGDSFVESYGVLDSNRFPHQTERLVYEKSEGKFKVEVMGFGASGWGQVHAYGAIKKYVLKYSPDEIWLTFLPTNDFGDNTPILQKPPQGPTFVYESPESNKIIDIKFGWPDIPADLWEKRKGRFGEKVLRGAWANWSNGLLPHYWATENDPHWDLIEDHTFQTLELIKKICDENGIKLSLVYRMSGYDQDELNFNNFKKDATKHIGRDIGMKFGHGKNRFKKKIEAMGINFIDTLNMKYVISRKAEEMDVNKHYSTANFFSEIILKNHGWQQTEKISPETRRYIWRKL